MARSNYVDVADHLSRTRDHLTECRELWESEIGKIWHEWPYIYTEDSWRRACEHVLSSRASAADKAAWIEREEVRAKREREDRESRQSFEKQQAKRKELREGWPFLTEAEFSRYVEFMLKETWGAPWQEQPTSAGLRQDMLDERMHQFEMEHGHKVGLLNRSKFEKWVRRKVEDRRA